MIKKGVFVFLFAFLFSCSDDRVSCSNYNWCRIQLVNAATNNNLDFSNKGYQHLTIAETGLKRDLGRFSSQASIELLLDIKETTLVFGGDTIPNDTLKLFDYETSVKIPTKDCGFIVIAGRPLIESSFVDAKIFSFNEDYGISTINVYK